MKPQRNDEAPKRNSQSWWSWRGNKRKSSEADNMWLSLPDFESDDLQSVQEIQNQTADGLQDAINTRRDERINELSGLWSPVYSINAGMGRRRRRATDLSEEQLVDLVLETDDTNNELRETESEQPSIPEEMSSASENTTSVFSNNNVHHHHISVMKELQTTYQKRRQDLRSMANAYLERNRNDRLLVWPPDPAAPRNATVHPRDEVHIDLHGRLVRGRPEAENQREGASENNNNHDGDNEKLVDAADTFWRYQSLAEIQRKVKSNIPLTREEKTSLQSAAADTTTIQVPNPIVLAPLRQAQGPQQITEQMERDARNAIERALERYQRQSNANARTSATNDDRVFELIPIPMVRRENEDNNETRWFGRFTRRNNANDDVDNPAPDINNQHPAGMGPNNDRPRPHPGWIDTRLAFRRICLAVLTVVAAFICTMLQGIPELGDDTVYVNGIEVDSLWFTGLLGPHFTGHYPSGRPSVPADVRRRRFDYRVLKEGAHVMEDEMSSLEQFLNELFEDEEELKEDSSNDSAVGQDDGPMECGGSHEYV